MFKAHTPLLPAERVLDKHLLFQRRCRRQMFFPIQKHNAVLYKMKIPDFVNRGFVLL